MSAFTRLIKEYPVISIIIIINLVTFLAVSLPVFPNKIIFQQMAGVNILIESGQLWRLVTPIFVHTNLQHFLFNSFALLLFGSMLEKYHCRKVVFIIYIISGIFGNIITLILAPPAYVHVGSSGAVFGLIGAVAILIYLNKLPEKIAQSLKIYIIAAILISFIQPNINVFSHIGGLMAGMIIAFFLQKYRH